MIKEAISIDFYTSGKELSEQDFARISEWIRKNKEKVNSAKPRKLQKRILSHKALPQFGRAVKSSA
jgi:hypothetical protein